MFRAPIHVHKVNRLMCDGALCEADAVYLANLKKISAYIFHHVSLGMDTHIHMYIIA